MSDTFLRAFVAEDKDLGCQLAILPSEQKGTYALGVRKGFQYEQEMKRYFASDFKWLALQILLPLQLPPHQVEADRDPRKVCFFNDWLLQKQQSAYTWAMVCSERMLLIEKQVLIFT